jgi:hypothetical protein
MVLGQNFATTPRQAPALRQARFRLHCGTDF